MYLPQCLRTVFESIFLSYGGSSTKYFTSHYACGNMSVMGNTPSTTNGKSTLIHDDYIVKHETRTSPIKSNPRYPRVLDLVRDAVDLEIRLKATMDELDKEMRAIGNGSLPAVLVSLMKHQPYSQKKSTTSPNHVVANKGGRWKAKIMGLMADGKERRSSDVVKQLKAKNATTIYSILSALADEGHLIRTKFAHYRLKMRKA